MKYLNYIDFGYQTLVLGLVALVSIATAVTGHLETIGILALYGGVFLGPWQMVSSLMTVIARGLYFKWRVIHLLSSIGYIVIVSVIAAFFGECRYRRCTEGRPLFPGFRDPGRVGVVLLLHHVEVVSV